MMQHWVYTEAGHSHLNEDTVLVYPHPEYPDVLLCVMADGQGGQAGGAAASRTAAEKCLEEAKTYTLKQLMEPATWYLVLNAADEAVCEKADAGLTTLIGFCVAKDAVCGASCGDSDVRLIGRGQNSLLTENQRKNPPVGSGEAYPVAFEAQLQAEWKLLVMSDGVWRYISDNAISKAAAQEDGQSLILALRQMQQEQNGGVLPDDFSAILLQSDQARKG